MYNYTVPYEFDTSNITEADQREVIKRHYDFIKWCENNTNAPYAVDSQYNPTGITVHFGSEENLQDFLEYAGNYWIFLHN